MLSLDYDEVRAAYHAVAAVRRGWAIAGRPVPYTMHTLYNRLDVAIRCPPSPARHETGSGAGEFEAEWIGTRTAAAMLDWHPRKVQRHADDLDGQLVGGRLVFPARSVREYAKHVKKEQDPHD